VRVGEIARASAQLSEQFRPLVHRYSTYIAVANAFIGAYYIVRERTRVLASDLRPGPQTLPLSGVITYRGRQWLMVSSSPAKGVRIYVLAPTESTTLPPTGPTLGTRAAADTV
jgi:hypothetical protein